MKLKKYNSSIIIFQLMQKIQQRTLFSILKNLSYLKHQTNEFVYNLTSYVVISDYITPVMGYDLYGTFDWARILLAARIVTSGVALLVIGCGILILGALWIYFNTRRYWYRCSNNTLGTRIRSDRIKWSRFFCGI